MKTESEVSKIIADALKTLTEAPPATPEEDELSAAREQAQIARATGVAIAEALIEHLGTHLARNLSQGLSATVARAGLREENVTDFQSAQFKYAETLDLVMSLLLQPAFNAKTALRRAHGTVDTDEAVTNLFSQVAFAGNQLLDSALRVSPDSGLVYRMFETATTLAFERKSHQSSPPRFGDRKMPEYPVDQSGRVVFPDDRQV